MLNPKKKDIVPEYRVNEEIRFHGSVRIVGEGIESRVVPIGEARRISKEMGLDLVEIQGKLQIPVLKLCNYDKMLYELKKLAKKKKHASRPMKDIPLSVNIARHDLETKVNNARKFIESGCRVRVILTMKGRELARREENKKSILEFIVMLDDIATPEAAPRDDNNKTVVILKKKAKKTVTNETIE